MTIDAVLVGKKSTATQTATTDTSGPNGGTTTTGSGFLILAAYDGTTAAATPTDSKGNTYTAIGTVQTDGNSEARLTLYRCVPGDAGYVGGGASHTATMTWAPNNAFATLYLIEITGIAATGGFDQTAQGNDPGAPFTLASPTLGQASEVVIAICEANHGVTAANTYSSSNFTILAQETDGGTYWTSAVAKLVVSATTPVTPSFTCTAGTAGALFLATFKDASSGAAAATDANLNLRRNRPGRGPYSLGRYFRPVGETAQRATQIVADLAVTEANDTLASTAAEAIAASAAVTESADTVTSTATEAIAAAAALAETDDTLSGTATEAIAASLAVTEAADTLVASAAEAIVAVASIAEADDTLSSTATEAIVAGAAITEAGNTVSSTATEAIVVNAAITEADDTLQAMLDGTGITADLAVTEADDTAASTAAEAIAASASLVEEASALAAVAAAAIIAAALMQEADDALSSHLASASSGDCATAADVWGYVLGNGQTAEETLLQLQLQVLDLYRIHGLKLGEPLAVSTTQRTAGPITQAIAEASGTTTVTRQ